MKGQSDYAVEQENLFPQAHDADYPYARHVRALREVFLGKIVTNILWDGDHHHLELWTSEGVRVLFEAQTGPEGSVRLTWEIQEDRDDSAS